MNTQFKREKLFFAKGVSLFFLFVLGLHFSISLSYNFNEITKQPAFVSSYMEPLFTQNFKIFAPDVPTVKHELFVRYYFDNGKWSSWNKPGEHLLQAFQKNRFSSSRYEYLLHKNAVNELILAQADANYYAKKNKVAPELYKSFLANSIRSSQHVFFVEDYLMAEWRNKFPKQNLPKHIVYALSIQKISPPSYADSGSQALQPEYLYFPEIDRD